LAEGSRPLRAGGDGDGVGDEGSRAGGRRGGLRRFLRERRRYWIVPIAIMAAVGAILFLVAQGAKLVPLVRGLF